MTEQEFRYQVQHRIGLKLTTPKEVLAKALKTIGSNYLLDLVFRSSCYQNAIVEYKPNHSLRYCDYF